MEIRWGIERRSRFEDFGKWKGFKTDKPTCLTQRCRKKMGYHIQISKRWDFDYMQPGT